MSRTGQRPPDRRSLQSQVLPRTATQMMGGQEYDAKVAEVVEGAAESQTSRCVMLKFPAPRYLYAETCKSIDSRVLRLHPRNSLKFA
jgi:hypothetical protein